MLGHYKQELPWDSSAHIAHKFGNEMVSWKNTLMALRKWVKDKGSFRTSIIGFFSIYDMLT